MSVWSQLDGVGEKWDMYFQYARNEKDKIYEVCIESDQRKVSLGHSGRAWTLSMNVLNFWILKGREAKDLSMSE